MRKKTSALALTTLVGLSIAFLTGCGLGGGSTVGGGPNTTSNTAANNATANASGNGVGNVTANNATGNNTANVTGNTTGNTTGNNTANVTGNTTGNATGNSQGNTSGNNVATGNTASNNAGNTAASGTGNTTGNNTSTPSSGNTTSSGQASLSSMTVGSVTVSVPSNWTSSPLGGGGDFSGIKLTNPANSNERIMIVSSACVGCYTDAQGSANPKLVIPEANATNVVSENNGQSVSYTVPASNGGYSGQGMVTVSSNQSGYGYVEVYVPSSQSSLASQVLKSFTLSGQ